MITYQLQYDNYDLAVIQIDETFSGPHGDVFKLIKDMVEFYEGEQVMEDEVDKQNLIENWLKRLAMFILRNNRAPNRWKWDNDEGYIRLDGTQGITVIDIIPFEFDEGLIDVLLI